MHMSTETLPSITVQDFLRFFPDHHIQYFDDTEAKDIKKAFCTDHLDPEQAARKQEQGCGVYFSPNAFLAARKIENLLRIQALYVDLDCAKEGDEQPRKQIEQRKAEALAALRAFALPPHAIIETKNGVQPIWLLKPLGPDAKQRFDEAEVLLIAHFHADPGAKDVTRVLRLPCYHHLKNPADPFLCHLAFSELERPPYDLDAIITSLQALSVFGGKAQDAEPQADAPKKWQEAKEGVEKGGRNHAATSVAGRILHDLPEELWETVGWGGMKEWNERNTPPLPELELKNVFQSILKKEQAKREKAREDDDGDGKKRRSQADRLVEYVITSETLLFHDEFREPFAWLPVGDHRETYRIKSKNFKRWASHLFWEQEEKTPNPNAISSALTTLEGMAAFDGRQITLHNRIARHDGALWYDLSNEKWEAVRITADGWEIVSNPPVLFHRFSHQAPQVHPAQGGDVRTLLRYARLARKEQEVLLLVALIASCIPGFPHPVFILYGDQGAAKTTLSKVLRRIIDPSQIKSLSMPNTVQELAQLLSHHHSAFFDNLSGLPEWASDALCRAVTGDGFTKRELYSDDDDVIYKFQRIIALNGINIAASKPDLLDRSILFKLERIPKCERKAEQAFWEEFDAALPGILGGVLDALSAALRLRPGIHLLEAPRMADFAVWGCAIAEAIGYSHEEFLDAYYANINEQHEEAIHENPVATVIAILMEERELWESSPADLLERMETIALEQKISTNAKVWPKAPQALTRRLNEAKTNLSEIGIQIETGGKGAGGRRIIAIGKTGKKTADASSERNTATPSSQLLPFEEALPEAEKDGSGDSGGISPSLSSF